MAVLMAGLDAAAWFVITGRIEAAIPAFVAAAAQRGLVIRTGPVQRSGWPWSAQAEAPDVLVTLTPFNAAWRAGRVVAAVQPSDPAALQIEPRGPQTIRFGDGQIDAIDGGEAKVRAPRDPRMPIGVSIEDMAVRAHDGTGLRIARLDAQVGEDVATGTALIQPLRAWPPPFDGVADVSARLVMRPLPQLSGPAESISSWQAEQGRVDVPEFSIAFGPLQVSGSGSGGLDQQLQPRLALQLHLRGVAEALDAAVQAGILPQGAATAAKAVFAVLTIATLGGPVTVPASLDQGVLTVAGFPLLRVPRVAWSPP